MKKLALMTAFLVILWGNAQTQSSPSPPEDYFVVKGDTIINSSIELKEVVLFQPLRFYNYDEAKRYVILRERTYKVYPYAKMAADRLNVLTGRLEQIRSKRKRREYLKRLEHFIYNEFEKELEKLSRSQGRILIKLVHRQTGETTHQLLKDLRNGWRAFIYQTTASLFKLSLKETYAPESVYEDYMIEDILQRAFSVDRLELQGTALDYDLDSLYQFWNENKPKSISQQKP
tara:strand:- start:323 stop:1015 length:693 start_codon:yes stop_codon:yes gene_type:complete